MLQCAMAAARRRLRSSRALANTTESASVSIAACSPAAAIEGSIKQRRCTCSSYLLVVSLQLHQRCTRRGIVLSTPQTRSARCGHLSAVDKLLRQSVPNVGYKCFTAGQTTKYRSGMLPSQSKISYDNPRNRNHW